MSKRILVVEDDPALLMVISRSLTGHGYLVETAENGVAALSRMAGEAPFDLLLSDIVMPEMDGLELTLMATAQFPALKVILMSGYASEWRRTVNLENVIHGVINKPFALDELYKKVAEIIGN
jgi:CheY-like chemotaxis protein